MDLNVNWKRGEHPFTYHGTDADGNEYTTSADSESVSCKLASGHLGCGWTAVEARENAIKNSQEA